MSVHIVTSRSEALVDASVLDALRNALVEQGSAVLLVPSFAQALDVQRALTHEPGLSLGVTVTTPAAWVKERWEIWGDGRAIADDVVLAVLARQVICDATPEARGPMRLSAGLVNLLARLADQALPWLPLDAEGNPQLDRCAAAGITYTESLLVGLVGALGKLLASKGYLTNAQAFVAVPQALAQAQAKMPGVVAAGFNTTKRRERTLLHALGELANVTVVAPYLVDVEAYATRELAADNAVLADLQAQIATQVSGVSRTGAPDPYGRDPHLCAVRELLFSGETIDPEPEGPIQMLLATGPVAEAELVAARVDELVKVARAETEHAAPQTSPRIPVVVAVPDVVRAHRELLPKLVARGLDVRISWSRALRDTPPLQAFLAYARTVATLLDLAQAWPEPEMGLEGPVPRPGDMSWWPPRELVDFLLSGISGMEPAAAWRLDAAWRGNRLLTPAQVLATLQSERETSAPVARATTELLRGRLGSAASKLLAPYVREDHPASEGAAEAQAALAAVLRIAGTLRELGVSADPYVEGALPLTELVRLAEWAAEGMSMVGRQATAKGETSPEVLVCGMHEAARLAPGAASALVICGCTTMEQPVESSDDLFDALMEKLGVEPLADAMEDARVDFVALLGVPSTILVLERSLTDDEGKETYLSVMLSELLATLGIAPGAKVQEIPVPVEVRAETELAQNRAADGTGSSAKGVSNPLPAGRLTGTARELVFVPQAGRDRLEDDVPVLSASQIETYLDCPYKWFSLRRLRLGSVDAGHTGLEMGTFAHRVLEKTHGALLARALGADDAALDDDALRALAEAHLTEHVPGSAVEVGNLDAARAALELEFDLHQQHMYMARKPRLAQQLLVAHNAFERAQEQTLREDLLSCLEYQTRILAGFEPRFFEWGFGKHDNFVSYAGAYFTGTVDRIDVSPHGTAVIIDYKHKSPVGFAAEYDALQDGVLEGVRLPNRVQSLIYAQIVRRAFEDRLRLVGTVYLSTKSPHALAGAADENVADLVFGRVGSARESRVCVPRTQEGAPGMNDLLDRTEELVAEQVAQMRAGNVEARPRDKRSCDFCPVMQCEKRVMR